MSYYNFQYDGVARAEVRLPDYNTPDYDWLQDATIDFMHDHLKVEDVTAIDAAGELVEEYVQSMLVPVVWRMRHVIAPEFYNIDGSSRAGS